jgi:predicted amino acid dehydrogenase
VAPGFGGLTFNRRSFIVAIVRFATEKINPDQTADDIQQDTAASIGTGHVLEVLYDDAAFTGEEGRQRLALALERVLNRVKSGQVGWPVV